MLTLAHAHGVLTPSVQHRAQCWSPRSWEKELLWCWGNEAVCAAEELLGREQQGAVL